MLFEINNTIKARFSQKFVKKIIDSFSKVTQEAKSKTVSIALVDNKTIKRLNKIYRGQDKVTDVLSFTYKTSKNHLPTPSLQPPTSNFLGEVVICWPQVKKQAKEYGHSPQDELAVLLAHGLLHLIGFDHTKKKEAKEMFSLQEKIVSKITR